MLGSDESGPDSPQSDRSLLQSSSSSALSSDTVSSSARPKTTKRLDTILHEDLRTYGAMDSRLSTPSSYEDDVSHTKRRPPRSGFINTSEGHDESLANPLLIKQYKEKKGRVKIMDNNNIDQGFSNVGGKTAKKQQSKVDDLLHQEQDDLAMSLSQSKFLLLKNANLERVKSQSKDILVDNSEMKQLEKMKSKLNLDGINAINDSSPNDTFKDIPQDVFDKIPRAVTARLERQNKKQQQPETLDLEVDYEPSAPSAPAEDSLRTRTGAPEVGSRQPPVGIIAMLFSGAGVPVVARPGPGARGQVEQDFMFALFLQKQEQAEAEQGAARSRPRDPDVGHFCAPNTPGFCEANFCIFHSNEK